MRWPGANFLAPPGDVARWPGAHSDWPGPGAGVVVVFCAIARVGSPIRARARVIGVMDFMRFSFADAGQRTERDKVAGNRELDGCALLRRCALLAGERRHHLVREAAE